MDRILEAIGDKEGTTRVPEQYRDRVPETVVLSSHSEGLTEWLHLLHAVLCSELASATTDEDEKHRLRRQSCSIMNQVDVPEVSLWMSFGNDLIPKQVVGLVQMMVGSQARIGLEVKRGDDWIEFVSPLGSLVTQDRIRKMLLRDDYVTDFEDPEVEVTAKRLASLVLRLRLEIDGTDLSVCLDDPHRDNPDVSADSLELSEELWAPSPEQFAYAQWNFQEVLRAAEELRATWLHWRSTPAGHNVAIADEEDSWITLSRFPSQLSRFGVVGSAQVTCDDRLTIKTETYGHEVASSIDSTGVSRFVDRNKEYLVRLTACESVADWIAMWLDEYEGRLEAQTLKFQIQGEQEKARMSEWMSKYLYQDFTDFRQTVYSNHRSTFFDTAALFVTSNGCVGDLQVDFVAAGFDHSVGISNAPFLEVALVAKARSNTEAEQYYSDLWRGALKAIHGDPGPNVLHELKPGIGAPTKRFILPETMHWKAATAQIAEVPTAHLTTVDNWVIFSTSFSLTRSLVASLRAGDGDLAQEEDAVGDLVAYGSFPSSIVGGYMKMVGDWCSAAASGKDPRVQLQGMAFDGPVKEDLLPAYSDVFLRMGEAVSIGYERAGWSTWQHEDVRRSEFVIVP